MTPFSLHELWGEMSFGGCLSLPLSFALSAFPVPNGIPARLVGLII
jgi:hypothetical protein